MTEPFHMRLQRLREAKGWDIERLAKRSGVSKKLLKLLEEDERQVPAWHSIIYLAVVLETNPFYLASGEGNSKPYHVQQNDAEAAHISLGI